MAMFSEKKPDEKVQYQRPDQLASGDLPPTCGRTTTLIDDDVFVSNESKLVNENGTIFNQNIQSMTYDSLGNVVPKGTQIAKSWTKQLIYSDNDYGSCEDLFELHEHESRRVLFKKDGGLSPIQKRIMCSECVKYNKFLNRLNFLFGWLGWHSETF